MHIIHPPDIFIILHVYMKTYQINKTRYKILLVRYNAMRCIVCNKFIGTCICQNYYQDIPSFSTVPTNTQPPKSENHSKTITTIPHLVGGMYNLIKKEEACHLNRRSWEIHTPHLFFCKMSFVKIGIDHTIFF